MVKSRRAIFFAGLTALLCFLCNGFGPVLQGRSSKYGLARCSAARRFVGQQPSRGKQEFFSRQFLVRFVGQNGDSEEKNSDGSNREKSLVVLLDDLGKSFKVRAQKNSDKGEQAQKTSRKVFYTLLASFYYTLFIIYRAYRGFFVLLPAVFRSVYARLEVAMQSGLSLEETTDSNAATKKPSWRTRITVSVLAAVVTFSYVLGGMIRVVATFFRTITKTSSVRQSFEAAAEELVDHEGKVRKIGEEETKAGGDQPSVDGGLYP